MRDGGQEMVRDEKYMRMALELAVLGRGFTAPNPVVGAVIVKDAGLAGERIIGQGYHERYGDLHAERNALRSCRESPAGSTMYVTLEPCCHQGRQPPCTDAILEAGIARVVVGSSDPNPLVCGKGVGILRAHGVEVTEGVLREECDRENEIFFHYIRTGTPYVVMKYAMTMDGKIAAYTGASKWITGEAARLHVQQLRHELTGIMCGVGTVLADDPLLTCRLPGKKNPVRIICDTNLRTPIGAKVVATAREGGRREVQGKLPYNAKAVTAARQAGGTGGAVSSACCEEEKGGSAGIIANPARTIIATSCGDEGRIADYEARGCRILRVGRQGEHLDLKELMKRLGEEKIDSILLEGGGTLNWSALESGIVNRVMAYVSPKIFGGRTAKTPVEGQGAADPSLAYFLKEMEITRIGEDILLEGRL